VARGVCLGREGLGGGGRGWEEGVVLGLLVGELLHGCERVGGLCRDELRVGAVHGVGRVGGGGGGGGSSGEGEERRV